MRTATRVAEQAKPALKDKEHEQEAGELANRQTELGDRVEKVARRIEQLKEGAEIFAGEIALLGQVVAVMSEASGILGGGETGPPAIGTETEAIELLLQSKRISTGSGGGGGSAPGGGGGGTTQQSALALLGTGVNQKEERTAPEVTPAVGARSHQFPAEYRTGLDEYFKRLEQDEEEVVP